jgi:hypothetical protein
MDSWIRHFKINPIPGLLTAPDEALHHLTRRGLLEEAGSLSVACGACPHRMDKLRWLLPGYWRTNKKMAFGISIMPANR